MAAEQVSCSFPVGKILAGVGWGLGEISGAYPLMVSTLSGAQLEDTEKFPPSRVGGWVKKPSRIPSQWKGTGRGPRLKEIEAYPGLS